MATALIALEPHTASGFTHWTLGPHVGWARTTDSDESALTLGVATRLKLFEILAGELAVDWRSEEIEAGDINTVPVQLSALVYPLPVLHGTLGIGWYRVDASLDAIGQTIADFDDAAWDAGVHLGGGIELPLGSTASLTGELRYVFLGYELEDVGQTLEADADFLNLLVGLQFQIW